jgi:hypothetical protein
MPSTPTRVPACATAEQHVSLLRMGKTCSLCNSGGTCATSNVASNM